MTRSLWLRLTGFATGVALLIALLVLAMRHDMMASPVDLARTIPASFGPWRQVSLDIASIDPNDRGEGPDAEKIYDSVLDRSYRRQSDGAEVLLTLAYRRSLTQEQKIHRPELCYSAQGFVVSNFSRITVSSHEEGLPANMFRAVRPGRSETVTYWIRIGDVISGSPWQTRLALMRLSARGLRPDGILVRASVVTEGAGTGAGSKNDVKILKMFLRDILQLAPEHAKQVLAGRRV